MVGRFPRTLEKVREESFLFWCSMLAQRFNAILLHNSFASFWLHGLIIIPYLFISLYFLNSFGIISTEDLKIIIYDNNNKNKSAWTARIPRHSAAKLLHGLHTYVRTELCVTISPPRLRASGGIINRYSADLLFDWANLCTVTFMRLDDHVVKYGRAFSSTKELHTHIHTHTHTHVTNTHKQTNTMRIYKVY